MSLIESGKALAQGLMQGAMAKAGRTFESSCGAEVP